MNAIEITGLSKTYKGKRLSKVEALKELDLAIEPGEIFGFLGPNGAGKSTTIKILTGQISSTSGSATICGCDVGQHEARKKIGYLPENPALYDFLTAREYLRFVGRVFAMEPSRIVSETERVLEMLDLDKTADRPVRSFSKGMVQRLGLAQTLLHDPDIYLLDEPMSGLDPIGRALVKDIIKDLGQQGKTVFFSTHITADVEAVCDRLGIIAKGRLMALDTVQDVLVKGQGEYAISVQLADGDTEEILVAKEQLQGRMEELWRSGRTIIRIEQNVQDIENYFLDVVAKAE